MVFKRICLAVGTVLALWTAAAEVPSLALPLATVGEATDCAARMAPGRVVPVARVDIRPQVSGEILAVTFSNGQAVAKGDVLYRLKRNHHHDGSAVWIGDDVPRCIQCIGGIAFRHNQRNVGIHTERAGIVDHYGTVLGYGFGEFP